MQFTDLSTKATRWNWEFGDGNSSIDQNPTYTYFTEGVYTVYLTASNAYGQSSKTATINVLAAPLKDPTIAWSNPVDITAGTTLGSKQLNAIATDPNTGNSVTGTFTYNPEEGTVLEVGTHTLHVDFTPSDSTTYNMASADVQINVLPAPLKTPTIIWSKPADITVGTALGSTQLNAMAKDPVSGDPVESTFTYDPAAGTVLSAGMGQILNVNFVPTYTTNYNPASTDVKINVLKATPEITWSNPVDITYGTVLSNTQLNADASVSGTFTYTLPDGTSATGAVLDVGTHKLHVDFTPSDALNYNTVSKDVTINVLEKPAIPTANFWASPTVGKVSSNIQFTDTSTGVPTSWSWDFGDKSTSTGRNPVHTYSKAGKYTVSLTVKNDLGSNTRQISKYITVEDNSKKK